MATLAVLSDIHGNAGALTAVLADIESRDIDGIVNLGDCAYGPFDPRPVLDELIRRDIPSVSGNEDRVLVEVSQGRARSRTAVFSTNWLRPRHLRWLGELPMVMRLGDATCFHAIPSDDTTYLLTAVDETGLHARDPEDVARLVSACSSRILLCGHDHTPGDLALESGQRIINPGSVGCPAYTDDTPYKHAVECGTPHARYAVLEIREQDTRVSFVNVSYDWQAAAREADANGFPDWATWISTGQI